MIVEKISLLVPFVDDQFGTYLQKKVTMDIILQEGDTPEKALDYALETVTAWNQSIKKLPIEWEKIADLPPSLKPTITIQSEPQISEHQRLLSLIGDIYSCDELKILESYRLLAKSHPAIQEAYDNMLKKLTT